MKELSSTRVPTKYVDVCRGYLSFLTLHPGISFKVNIPHTSNKLSSVEGYFIIGIIIGNYIL